MKRLAVFALCLWACDGAPPELRLAILMPDDRELLRAVTRLDLHAERDTRTIAQHSFARDATFVSLHGVPYGPNTTFILEGITAANDVAGRGVTCPIDYIGPGADVPLYFAPVNFFATTSPPLAMRDAPSAVQLSGGDILLFGGMTDRMVLTSAERFTPGRNRFTATDINLITPRTRAEVALVPDIGALIVGGADGFGNAIGNAEIWNASLGSFTLLESSHLPPRVGHIAVTLSDGRIFIAGGQPRIGGSTLDSSALVRVLADGTATVIDGPALNVPRYAHSAVVAPGSVIVFGGFSGEGAAVTALDSIEIADLHAGLTDPPALTMIPERLNAPRADATATLLDDGTVLLVGGRDSSSVRGDAELWNPVTRQSETLPLATPRSGHRATLLPGGRVLVTGGLDGSSMPLSSVELYVPGIGFVSERPLQVARAGHVAVTLCDNTVLVVGGGAGAEVYTPPAQ